MRSISLEQIDWHLAEAGCLLEVVTHIAELEDEERSRLRPAAITVLYVLADKLRAADKALAMLRQTPP